MNLHNILYSLTPLESGSYPVGTSIGYLEHLCGIYGKYSIIFGTNKYDFYHLATKLARDLGTGGNEVGFEGESSSCVELGCCKGSKQEHQ